MDTDDTPSEVQIPQLAEAGTPEQFLELFFDEIGKHHGRLPLIDFCTNHGWGDDVSDETLKVDEFCETSVSGVYSFTFNETYRRGDCHDRIFSERSAVKLAFFYDRESGILELSGTIPKREFDGEEI